MGDLKEAIGLQMAKFQDEYFKMLQRHQEQLAHDFMGALEEPVSFPDKAITLQNKYAAEILSILFRHAQESSWAKLGNEFYGCLHHPCAYKVLEPSDFGITEARK